MKSKLNAKIKHNWEDIFEKYHEPIKTAWKRKDLPIIVSQKTSLSNQLYKNTKLDSYSSNQNKNTILKLGDIKLNLRCVFRERIRH